MNKASQKGSTLVVVTIILTVVSILAIKATSVSSMAISNAVSSTMIREQDSLANGALHHLMNPITQEQQTLANQPILASGKTNPYYLPYFMTSTTTNRLSGFNYTGIDDSDNPSGYNYPVSSFQKLILPVNLNTEHKFCLGYGGLRSISPSINDNSAILLTWSNNSIKRNNSVVDDCLSSVRQIKKTSSTQLSLNHDYAMTPELVSGGDKTTGNVFTATAVSTLLSNSVERHSSTDKINKCALNYTHNSIYAPTTASADAKKTTLECLDDLGVVAKQLSATFIRQ